MRILWAGILPVVLVLGSPTVFKAVPESGDGSIRALSSEATYVGPVLSDQALDQRARNTTRSIDIYNVWTSFQKIDLKANFNITGHSYMICQDRHPKMFFGSFVFVLDSPITVEMENKLSQNGRGKGSVKCTYDIAAAGLWLLTCEADPGEIESACLGRGSSCYYKNVSIHRVTRGGTGNIRETAYFDVWDICP